MIFVKEFKDADIIYIMEWLHLRELPVEFAKELPAIGAIAYKKTSLKEMNEYEYISAGFIRIVEGDFYFMDSLITNPKSAARDRDDAIDKVVGFLIDIVKKSSKRRILCWSKDENTRIRGKKWGFKEVPTQVMALNLEEGK